MEKQEKYIQKQEISPEEEQKIEALEQDTDKIYALRAEMYSLWGNFRDYLPSIRKGKKAHWEELEKWQEESSLEENIDFKKLEDEIERSDFNDEEKEDDLILKKDEILSSIEEALVVYRELKELGGDKPIGRAGDTEDVENFYKFRIKELGGARFRLSEIEGQIEANRRRYNKALSSSLKNPGRARRRLNAEYQELEDKYKKILFSSPEAYMAVAYDQIREAKEIFDENGTIVETPFVKEKIRRILDVLKGGRPVFIHGELGAGKTEFAKHLGREYLSKNHLNYWEESNPKPSDSEALEKWEVERRAQAEILEVRGLKTLEKEDITAGKSIEREEAPAPEEQVQFFNNAWKNYKKTVLDKAVSEIKDEKEKKEFLEKNEKQLEKAYFEKWKANITVVEKLSPIFQAMKEGRPVLVDEINAIPHHVLIVLNDIINKKPGDIVFTPAGEKIVAQEGFNLIATGNWKPEDGLMYVGRQPIDAAFLSRFGLEDYDFLPQADTFDTLLEGNDNEATRKTRQKNELFRMIVTRLLDKNLGAELPKDSIEKISDLAVASRILQNVFSGNEIDRNYYFNNRGTQVSPAEILKENVLSIRHLIPILENWKNDGFARDLDDYIFLEYVGRSKARPQEMKYIYQILKNQAGFFQGSDWPDAMDADALQGMVNYPIVKKMYGVDKLTGHDEVVKNEKYPELKYYSPKEIIEILFGPVSERKRLSKEILRPKDQEEEDEEMLMKIEKLQEFKELMGETGIDDFRENFLEHWESECKETEGEFVF